MPEAIKTQANITQELAGAFVKIGAGLGVLMAIGLILGVPGALAGIVYEATH